MTTVSTDAAGRLVVESPLYRLEVAADGLLATLRTAAGSHLASLRPLAAFDRVDGLDETLAIEPPRLLDGPGVAIEVARRSTVWERAATTIVCTDAQLELRSSVVGRGDLTDVRLLGVRSLLPGRPFGFLPSGSSFRTLFSPNPEDPGRLLRAAGEPAVIGVAGDGTPGRGHWFFTPAPLWLGLTTDGPETPEGPAPDGWLGLGLAAPVEELQFVEFAYEPADRAFALRLDYEGHTRVEGEFAAPPLLLTPGLPDPYAGLRAHRADLAARGAAPEPLPRETPAWWSRPIFCGWGAQCRLASVAGRPAPGFATQASYDDFLAQLERNGVAPGTVVIDDKWQTTYGLNEPDPERWPDLKGWIAGQRARGRHVLLWWKAWDPEGLEPDLCIRNPDGAPVAFDPTNPRARELLRRSVAAMLGPDGLDADGLKVDFTARTPGGRALAAHGPGWGIALLHDLLALVYGAAKQVKPDALVITHTPNPAFVDVTDMIRLNDMLRIDDEGPRPPVVPQMRYRAAVTRAACPELPIDTDDWCVPSLAEWREYLEAKPDIGVPSLYYVTHLDLSGEQLEQDDYAALRRVWDRWAAAVESAS